MVNKRQVKWGFWGQWVVATAVGSIVGLAGGWALARDTGNYWIGVMAALTSPAIFGACVGIIQWLVLQQRVQKPGKWIIASSVGWAVGGAMLCVVFWIAHALLLETSAADDLEAGLGGLFYGVIAGLLVGPLTVGIAQSLVLRIQVKQSGWWILASTIGWVLGEVTSYGIATLWRHDPGWLVRAISIGAAMGIVTGAITGGALIWLLRQPVSSTDAE